MTCQELTEFLMAWLDGELPQEQAAVFEHHLKLCPDCDSYLESYRQAVAMGQDAYAACDDERLPDEVPEQLVQAVLKAQRKGS
jgi:anti-sigma factor RsiW